MSIDVYFSQEQIANRVKELGEEITKDYEGKELAVVGVLNGAFMFGADLVRHINNPLTVDFVAASSYGDATVSSGKVELRMDVKHSIEGKHVLLVEDIVDTGITISSLLEIFKERNVASVKVASLLHKPSRTVKPVDIDYLAFEVEDKFVIGYGLDYAGRYRELPYIGIYSES
jgi:hypoxanthine phosphoribosyltransferase